MAKFNPADYETVAERIKRFYRDYSNGAIRTDLVKVDGDIGKTRWVVKASVFGDMNDDYPLGTGYAFEVDGSGMANNTSALENGETSAIGRALANANYSGDKRASREEMAKVISREAALDRIAAAKTMDALTEVHREATQAGWLDEDIQRALTSRKNELIEP